MQPIIEDIMNIGMEGGFSLPRFDTNDTWSYEETEDRVLVST